MWNVRYLKTTQLKTKGRSQKHSVGASSNKRSRSRSPKTCPSSDGPRQNTENGAAMLVNQIKTRIVWKQSAISSPRTVRQLCFPPTFQCFLLHLLSIRCVSFPLSVMPRLPFRGSLALWLTVRKAWIMSASRGTDGPSCAVGFFISQTYLNVPLAVPSG